MKVKHISFLVQRFKLYRFSYGLLLYLLSLLPLIQFSCKKDGSSGIGSDYYVKYIISSSTIYSGGKLNLTLTDEHKKDLALTVNQNLKNETIIGPVSKGFVSRIKAVAASKTYDKLKLYVEIHVSKNNNSFALKAIDGSDTPRDFVELNYKIDY